MSESHETIKEDETTTTHDTPSWCFDVPPLGMAEAISIGVGSVHHARSCLRIALASLPPIESNREVARRLKRALDHLDSALDAVS